MEIQMILVSSKATWRALEVVFKKKVQYNTKIKSYVNYLPKDIRYCNYLAHDEFNAESDVILFLCCCFT